MTTANPALRGTCRARTSQVRARLVSFSLVLLAASLASAEAPSPSAPADPALVGPPKPPPPPDPNLPRFEALERALKEQQEHLAKVQADLEQEKAALAKEHAALEEEQAKARAAEESLKPPPPTPPVFRISGFGQLDYVNRQSSTDQLDPTTSQPLNQNRFLVRRARLKLDIDHGIVAGVVELDANTVRGVQVRPLNVEASLRWPSGSELPPLIMGTVGQFKIPYSFEVLQSDTDRLFLERSNLARALFPGEFDLGLRVQGSWKFLRYAVAIMNGHPVGESTFPSIDPINAKDFVGRLGVESEVVPGLTIVGGISGLKGTGFHAGTPATKDALVWHDLNGDGAVQSSEIQVIPGSDSLPSSTFNRFAAGIDLRITYRIPAIGVVSAFGEATTAANLDRGATPADPSWIGRDLREQGFYVGATADLLDLVTVGVRYDAYQPDQDAFENKVSRFVPRDASLSTLAIAVGAHYQFGRLILEYDRNTNHLGRALNGTPASLKDDQFGVRAEVKF